MQEIAKNYFKSIQNGEEDKKLLEKLREIEATFSDNPAYLALLQSEYNTKGNQPMRPVEKKNVGETVSYVNSKNQTITETIQEYYSPYNNAKMPLSWLVLFLL